MDSVTCKKMDTAKPKKRNEIKWLLFTEIEAFAMVFKAFRWRFEGSERSKSLVSR